MVYGYSNDDNNNDFFSEDNSVGQVQSSLTPEVLS